MDTKPPARDEKGRLLPGQPSLNPGGRPAGAQEVATRIREALREKLDPDTAAQLAKVMVELSLAGNAKVMSLLLRTHGMLTDNVSIAGAPVSWNWQPGGGRSQAAQQATGEQAEETETEESDE